jgi:parvulin-like peptidyl-prolyl isomerase
LVLADLRLEVNMERMTRSRSAIGLLGAGAALGVAVAACGILASRSGVARSVQEGAVARVNAQIVAVGDYRRALAGLANDRRDGIETADRQRVVDRLVDEELLIQRGLELGLAHSDRRVRADLTAAVISAAIAAERSSTPSDAELEEFYASHRDMFVTTARVRLRQIFFRVAENASAAAAEERAREAIRRTQSGETFTSVAAELGDREIAPLPDALLSPAKLLDYLGPTALRVTLSLGEGEIGGPVRSGQGVHVLLVVEREPGSARAFADVRSQVAAELVRRRDEQALRRYLDRLRADAVIEVREGAL